MGCFFIRAQVHAREGGVLRIQYIFQTTFAFGFLKFSCPPFLIFGRGQAKCGYMFSATDIVHILSLPYLISVLDSYLRVSV
jgi:hypothetical protein